MLTELLVIVVDVPGVAGAPASDFDRCARRVHLIQSKLAVLRGKIMAARPHFTCEGEENHLQ
jgi:hypothetical protein